MKWVIRWFWVVGRLNTPTRCLSCHMWNSIGNSHLCCILPHPCLFWKIPTSISPEFKWEGYLECSGLHDVPSPVLASPHLQEGFYVFTIYICTTVTLSCPAKKMQLQSTAKPTSILYTVNIQYIFLTFKLKLFSTMGNIITQKYLRSGKLFLHTVFSEGKKIPSRN